MKNRVSLASGVSEFVPNYEAFIIDLWGVIHDGVSLYSGVIDCLQKISDTGKPYLMLTNAPRRAVAVAKSMELMGMPKTLKHPIISSGEATRLGLEERRDPWFEGVGKAFLHIGPERDDGLFENLDMYRVPSVEQADLIVNTGPWGDNETVTDYENILQQGAVKGIKMVCANPDLEVIRGGSRIICAGALAKRYEQMGGDVLYYGKPHKPIYDICLYQLGSPNLEKVLAIGDSLATDISGAVGVGIDSILVVGGIHGEEFMEQNAKGKDAIERRITSVCARAGHFPIAAINSFNW